MKKLCLIISGILIFSCKDNKNNNLITWVYESGSFVPSAKIVGEEKFNIINDYIGRPLQSYDDNGNLVWETEYDIYGGLVNLKGR